MKKLFALVALLLLISLKGYANETPLEYWLSVTDNKDLVNWLRNECQSAINPNHCFGVGMWIAKAESNFKWGDHWYFGMVGSNDKSISRWVKSYNKFWFRADDGFFFYGASGKLGKSHYCTSEISSNTKVWCPFWARNFDSFYSEYYKLFIKKDILAKNEDATIAHIQNINAWDEKQSPKQETKTQVKKVCRQVSTIKKDEYIQIDSNIGKFRQWIRNLIVGDKIFICKDI